MNPTPKRNKINRVAVIGAGPAGLTAVKCLREVNLEVVAFEKNPQIGGVWNFDESAPDGGGIAYRSLKTNTDKNMTAYSDFPFPQDLPTYPHRADVLAYFNSYADHFGLRPFIHLNTCVKHLTRQENGQWLLTYQQSSGAEKAESFEAVIVANGFYQKPLIPDIPGLEDFQGQIMHSAQFKGPEPFTDQRVVVIGSGSSGVDVAAEVGTTAENVDISIRSGVWIIPRHKDGKPVDINMFPLTSHLPRPIRKYIFEKTILSRYRELGYTDEQLSNNLKLQPFDPDKTRITASTALLERIRDGRVTLKGDIQRITADGVQYKDSSHSTADTLIFATGYAPGHPFLDPNILTLNDDYTFGLYRHVFHPQYDNLAFLAQCRVAGPVFPVMEMQARWVAAVFTGTAELPPPAVRQQHIEDHFFACRQRGANPMQVQHAAYMDEIAGQFGAQPRLLNHPTLIPKLLFAPYYPPRFRLDGPGKSDNAKELLERYND